MNNWASDNVSHDLHKVRTLGNEEAAVAFGVCLRLLHPVPTYRTSLSARAKRSFHFAHAPLHSNAFLLLAVKREVFSRWVHVVRWLAGIPSHMPMLGTSRSLSDKSCLAHHLCSPTRMSNLSSLPERPCRGSSHGVQPTIVDLSARFMLQSSGNRADRSALVGCES